MNSTTKHYTRMFGCDRTRIVKAGGKLFLILGWNVRSSGEWYRNGKPITFNYVREQVVASGTNMEELRASAKKYKRVLGMSWDQFFATPDVWPDKWLREGK